MTARSVWKSSLWLPQGAKREGGDWRLGGQGGGRGGGAEVQVGSCQVGGNEEGRVEGSRVWLVRDEQVWRKGPGLRLWVSQGSPGRGLGVEVWAGVTWERSACRRRPQSRLRLRPLRSTN